MSGFEVDTSGLKVLQDRLSLFTDKEIRKIITNGLKKAAAPIVKDVKRLAPSDKGEMGASVKAIVVRDDNGAAAVIVRPHLSGKSKKATYYAKFLERGTRDRKAKNGRAMYSTANGVGRYFVRARGIKARPFVAPAFDANKGKVAANVVNEVMGEIERSLSNG